MNRIGPPTEGNPGFAVLEDASDREDEQAEIAPLSLASRKIYGRFEGYSLRGKWLQDDRYTALRNAAWLVRNSRVGQANNALALKVVVGEVRKLRTAGEGDDDVVEALCELLVHP